MRALLCALILLLALAEAQDKCFVTSDLQQVYGVSTQSSFPLPAVSDLSCTTSSTPGWCIGLSAPCNYMYGSIPSGVSCPTDTTGRFVGGVCEVSAGAGYSAGYFWGCPSGTSLGTVVRVSTSVTKHGASASPNPSPVPITFPLTVNVCNHDSCAAVQECPQAQSASSSAALGPGAAAGISVGVILLVFGVPILVAIFCCGGLAAAWERTRKAAGFSQVPLKASTVVTVNSSFGACRAAGLRLARDGQHWQQQMHLH